MNSSTLHPEAYLSGMDTVLSNFKLSDENIKKIGNQMTKFKGIVGKYRLNPSTETKFEIGFTFYTISKVLRYDVLLQVGIADQNVIDEYPTLGLHDKAWSVSVVGCKKEHICLIAESGGNILEKLPISENKNNTTVSRKVLFHCIPHRNIIIVSINRPENEFVEFREVDFRSRLQPALAVYNPTLAITTLSNIKPKNLELDVTTLHRAVFISEDNNMISNTNMNNQFSKRNDVGNLVNYKGVVGDIQFNSKFGTGLPEYFEVSVDINVMAFQFDKQNHLFEIGFAHQDQIDNGRTLKKISAWFICAKRCSWTMKCLCLQTWHDGKAHVEIGFLCRSSERFKDTLLLGFTLDTKTKQIIFSRRDPREEISTFGNVPFDKDVYPVFGINDYLNVSLSLQMGESIPRFSIFGKHFKRPVCLL